MKNKENILKEIERKVNYAKNSYSYPLIYEVHGFIKGLYYAGAVTFEDIEQYERIICRECLNNPEWFNNENMSYV